MSFLSKEVREGLENARVATLRRASRLCIHDGDVIHKVTRLWDGGFAVLEDDAPMLHGLVDLYDGPRHLYQCLIVTSCEEAGERVYEFKWKTEVADRPPLDYARTDEAPTALLERF